ncbi:MAG: FHA domain-containing protein, partial [Planctomycetes bacterium]|nr:FHA domain-containing protein [Planctomycetota bacterium]
SKRAPRDGHAGPVPEPAQLFFDSPAGRQDVTPGVDGIVLVGRGDGCDIELDDDGVSWIHCCLVYRGSPERFLVRDLGSLNGTWVNGRRIEREATLRPGDILRVGYTIGRMVAAAKDAQIPPPPPWLSKRPAARHDRLPARLEMPDETVIFADLPPREISAAVRSQPAEPPVGPAGARRPVREPSRKSTRKAPAPSSDGKPSRASRDASRGRKTVLTDDWLEKLVEMERSAAAASEPERPTTAAAHEAAVPTHTPAGYGPRFRAGTKWERLRQTLDHLVMVGLPTMGVLTAALATLLLMAFVRLARDGLSVFIPFEGGGKQFTDLELVQIGSAMAAVLGAAIVVFYAGWKHAEEFSLITLCGLGAGFGCGILVVAGAVPADALYRLGLVLLALCAVGGSALFGIAATVPVGTAERVASGVAAALAAACPVLLWFPLRDGLSGPAELTIPMHMPAVAGQLIAAGVCAAIALGLFLILLRRVMQAYGDEPTRRWFDRYFIYHVAASALALLLLVVTNDGDARGWSSGLMGLTASVMLVVDYTLFVQVVRFTRYTL